MRSDGIEIGRRLILKRLGVHVYIFFSFLRKGICWNMWLFTAWWMVLDMVSGLEEQLRFRARHTPLFFFLLCRVHVGATIFLPPYPIYCVTKRRTRGPAVYLLDFPPITSWSLSMWFNCSSFCFFYIKIHSRQVNACRLYFFSSSIPASSLSTRQRRCFLDSYRLVLRKLVVCHEFIARAFHSIFRTPSSTSSRK